MILYCDVCNIHFSKKANYERHLMSQKHQKRKSFYGSMIQCNDCGRYFTTKSNCVAHAKRCKVELPCGDLRITNETVQMKKQIEQQQNEIDELKNKIILLLEKSSNTIYTENNIQNQSNIETQNVIVVNSFGQENTEYLTDQIVSKLIKNGPFTCLPKIIERIHFDPNHPENHNIKVTNKKLNYAEIIKDNKWITTNKSQIIEKMIQNGYDLLDEKYQDSKEHFSDFKQERFEDFQQKFQEEDKDLIKIVKNDVDITVLNGTDRIHK